jgi:plasmid maintenance system antidote protein VapI
VNKNVEGLMDLRRRNLVALKDQWGGWQNLAKKLKVTASHLSQIQSGHRPFSELTARQFEEKLGLSEKWLDLEKTTAEGTSQNDDGALLETIVDSLDSALKAIGKDMSRGKFFRVATFVHEDSKERGRQSEAWLRSLLRLILEEQ